MTLSNFQPDDDNVIIQPTVFHWSGPEQHVCISGSFQLHGVDDWTPVAMEKLHDRFTISLTLKPGEYQYKFVVDGGWTCDFQATTTTDSSGNVNNVITVSDTVITSVKDSSVSITSPVAEIKEPDNNKEASSNLVSELKPNQSEIEFILENRTSESPLEQPIALSKQNDTDLEDNMDNCKSSTSPNTLASELVDSNIPSLSSSSSTKPSHHNSLDSHTLDSEPHELTSHPIHDNLLQLELTEENAIEQPLLKKDSPSFRNNSLGDNNLLADVNTNFEKECDLDSNATNMEPTLNNQGVLETNQERREDSAMLKDTLSFNDVMISTKATGDSPNLITPSSSGLYGQETRIALDEICQLYSKDETPHQEDVVASQDNEQSGQEPVDICELALNKEEGTMSSTDVINLDSQQKDKSSSDNEVKLKQRSPSDEISNPASDSNKFEHSVMLSEKTDVNPISNEESSQKFNSNHNEPEYTLTFPLSSESINNVSKKECIVLDESSKEPDEKTIGPSDSPIEKTDLESLDQEKSTPILSNEALSPPEDDDVSITCEVDSTVPESLASTNLKLFEDLKESINSEANHQPDEDIITDYNKHHDSDFLLEPPHSSSESLDGIVIKNEADNLLAASTDETVLGSDEPKHKLNIHLEVLKGASSSNTVTLDDEFIHQKDTFVSDKEIIVSMQDQASLNESDKNLSSNLLETKEPEVVLLNSKVDDQPKSELSTSDENPSVAKSLNPNSPPLDLTKNNPDNSKPYNVVFVASKYLFFGVVALLVKFYRTFTWGMFFKSKNDDPKPDTKDGGPSKDNNALEKASSLSELSLVEIIAGLSLVILGLSAALIMSTFKLSI